jgi:hypothetical protein
MEAVRTHGVVEKDGEICLTGLPCKRGQQVEMIILIGAKKRLTKPSLSARHLLNSNLIGLWKNRRDIGDSVTYATTLRQQAQSRNKR